MGAPYSELCGRMGRFRVGKIGCRSDISATCFSSISLAICTDYWFVTISISVTDVIFEIYAPVNERYHYRRRNKTNIQCWHTNGLHFPLSFPIECTKISEEIAAWLDMIRKNFLKNYYLDVSAFNTISNHLDYKSIVEELTAM